MSIHVQTGHRLDVVYDYEDGHKVLRGLQPWDDVELFSLNREQAQALVDVLQMVLNEIALQEATNGKTNIEG
jgi:hypothetical protein